MKSSSKLLIVLIVLVAILAGFIYYLFTNSKPKEISFIDKNASQIEEIAQTPPSVNLDENASQSVNSSENFSKNDSVNSARNLSQNVASKREISTPNANSQGSLRSEYEDFLAKSKRDTSLGEPRYNVYLMNNARLNALQKGLVNEIAATLSRRGGYLHYALFVENLGESLKITLFNEDLLDTARWTGGLNMPNLWFKFAKYDLWSVKNSFHINTLKSEIYGSAIRAVEFSGHTDEIGDEAYNYALGLRRAAAVASEFLRQSGKITMQSFGKDKPLVQGNLESERYQNRRVESVFR